MRITADTNILVRAIVLDIKQQALTADTLLKEAELIAVPLSCLCEFVWVVRSVYNLDRAEIAAAISTLSQASNVVADWPAIDAGLSVHNAGGDFTDGVIAYEGRALGGEVFVSFDKQAVVLLQQQGHSALLAGALS